jgi:hypothetical protein
MQTNNHRPEQLDAFKEQTAQPQRDGLEAVRRKWAAEKASGQWEESARRQAERQREGLDEEPNKSPRGKSLYPLPTRDH